MDDGEFPALRRDLLLPPDSMRLKPIAHAIHKPCILLLYGSLCDRSYPPASGSKSRLKVIAHTRYMRFKWPRSPYRGRRSPGRSP
ncbi:hypothetical protein [Acidiphilium multivorum]|uniref:hypothetical protein n=1 Tax=Acidiphilium multivorum TaxID=62140 RepID=UPI001B8CC6DD|nr:hypothetical protein [Acidiphilium multivorum]MBS3025386.1 hypothetical protein [Acidiphilium multivorum]